MSILKTRTKTSRRARRKAESQGSSFVQPQELTLIASKLGQKAISDDPLAIAFRRALKKGGSGALAGYMALERARASAERKRQGQTNKHIAAPTSKVLAQLSKTSKNPMKSGSSRSKPSQLALWTFFGLTVSLVAGGIAIAAITVKRSKDGPLLPANEEEIRPMP